MSKPNSYQNSILIDDDSNDPTDDDNNIAKKRKLLTEPGQTGLYNLGNTCYMNATLQCLFALPVLNSYLRSNSYQESLEHNKLTEIVQKLRKLKNLTEDDRVEVPERMLTTMCRYSISYQLSRLFGNMYKKNWREMKPTEFKTTIGQMNPEFHGYGQNDSQELLNMILDKIHDETSTRCTVDFCNLSSGAKNL